MKLKFSIFLISALFIACVPARKFEELKDLNTRTLEENESLRIKVQDLSSRQKELITDLERLQEANRDMEADTTRMGRNMRRLQSQYEKINDLNDELLSKYDRLQRGSQEENAKMVKELESLRTELNKREDELNLLEDQLVARRKELEKLSGELETREARVNELESILKEKDESVAKLRKTISDALLGFQDEGLTVVQKEGKVYVSMEAKLLFPSGSTNVDPKGKEAIVELAKVLAGRDDFEIQVEGHTDSDQFKSAAHPKNNWELSVLRATSVVNIITENTGIDPKNLIASGRSEFYPVDSMDKAKNRRIEIILTPRLERLFELINQEENTSKETEAAE